MCILETQDDSEWSDHTCVMETLDHCQPEECYLATKVKENDGELANFRLKTQ
ncbi:MAG: hypothetical protein ACE5PO_09580 [Candidatus Bathyarchaeia archaeon]